MLGYFSFTLWTAGMPVIDFHALEVTGVISPLAVAKVIVKVCMRGTAVTRQIDHLLLPSAIKSQF